MSARLRRRIQIVLDLREARRCAEDVVVDRLDPSRPWVLMAERSCEEQVQFLWVSADPRAAESRITPCLVMVHLAGFVREPRRRRGEARVAQAASGRCGMD